jgi:LPXTG-motif cell wall-anchored protein
MSDEYEDSYEEFEEQPSGGGSGGNRNFVTAIVAVIVVFVVLIVGIGGFYFLTRGNSGNSGERNALAGTQAAMIYTQNAQTAAAATKAGATEVAKNLLPTETPIPPTTQAQGATSVVAFPTDTPAPTVINAQTDTTTTPGTAAAVTEATAESSEAAQRTATIAVLLTKVAASGGTPVAGLVGPLTPTALPQTGFMDEVGLPVLLGMAMLFIFIIFMARRLRVSANR